jgi:hypothetical protein
MVGAPGCARQKMVRLDGTETPESLAGSVPTSLGAAALVNAAVSVEFPPLPIAFGLRETEFTVGRTGSGPQAHGIRRVICAGADVTAHLWIPSSRLSDLQRNTKVKPWFSLSLR